MHEEKTTNRGGDLEATAGILQGMRQTMEADRRQEEIQHWMVRERFTRNRLYTLLDQLEDFHLVKGSLWKQLDN